MPSEKQQHHLTAAQRRVLQYLVAQVDGSPELRERLSKEGREALRATFGMGGFAWVQRHLAQSDLCAEGALTFGRFHIPMGRVAAASGDEAPETPREAFDF